MRVMGLLVILEKRTRTSHTTSARVEARAEEDKGRWEGAPWKDLAVIY